MSLIANPVSVTVTSAVPAWFLAMTDKTWSQIAVQSQFIAIAQTPSPSVGSASGPSEVVGTDNGAVVDEIRGDMIFAANGGHTDYSGDEVYLFKVRQTTPTWYRLTDRTPDGSIDYSAFTAQTTARIQNLDGLPRAMHGWNVNVYCEGYGKVIRTSTQGASTPLGYYAASMFSFNRDLAGDTPGNWPIAYATVAANGGNGAGYWTYLGPAWTTNPGSNEAAPGCWDPVNNLALGFNKTPQDSPTPGETLITIDPTSGAINRYNIVPASGDPIIAAVSVARTSQMVAVGLDYSSSDIYVLNLATITSGAKWLRKTPSGSSLYASGGGPWYHVWHSASNAFFLYNMNAIGGQRNIAKLTMNTPSDPLNSTWTYSDVSVPSGSTPPSSSHPSWSKFNIIRDMGNGQSCLLLADYGNGVWAFKVPLAGM